MQHNIDVEKKIDTLDCVISHMLLYLDLVPTVNDDNAGILTFCGVTGDHEAARAQHDVIGATYLRMLGFHERVAHLVEGHVLAKRYLCAVNPHYYDTLSNSSRRTLAYQGTAHSVIPML